MRVGNLHGVEVEFGVYIVEIVVVVVVGKMVVVVVVVVVVGNMLVVVVVGNMLVVVAVVDGNRVVATEGRPSKKGQTQSFLDWYLLYTNPHIPLWASFHWAPQGIVGRSGHALSTFFGTPLQKPSSFVHTTGG